MQTLSCLMGPATLDQETLMATNVDCAHSVKAYEGASPDVGDADGAMNHLARLKMGLDAKKA